MLANFHDHPSLATKMLANFGNFNKLANISRPGSEPTPSPTPERHADAPRHAEAGDPVLIARGASLWPPWPAAIAWSHSGDARTQCRCEDPSTAHRSPPGGRYAPAGGHQPRGRLDPPRPVDECRQKAIPGHSGRSAGRTTEPSDPLSGRQRRAGEPSRRLESRGAAPRNPRPGSSISGAETSDFPLRGKRRRFSTTVRPLAGE